MYTSIYTALFLRENLFFDGIDDVICAALFISLRGQKIYFSRIFESNNNNTTDKKAHSVCFFYRLVMIIMIIYSDVQARSNL